MRRGLLRHAEVLVPWLRPTCLIILTLSITLSRFFPDKVTVALNCVSEPSLSAHCVCEVDSAPCGAFGDSEVFRGEDAIALLEQDKRSHLLALSPPPPF